MIVVCFGVLVSLLTTKSNRGELGIITWFFLLSVFVIIWATVLGRFFATAGQLAISYGNLDGIEAFLAGNINLIVMICVILAVLAFAYGSR